LKPLVLIAVAGCGGGDGVHVTTAVGTTVDTRTSFVGTECSTTILDVVFNRLLMAHDFALSIETIGSIDGSQCLRGAKRLVNLPS